VTRGDIEHHYTSAMLSKLFDKQTMRTSDQMKRLQHEQSLCFTYTASVSVFYNVSDRQEHHCRTSLIPNAQPHTSLSQLPRQP
jgi:hypothetical protein